MENRNLCRSILAVGALLGIVFAIFLPWRIYTASLNAERYAFASQANEADMALYYIEKAAGQDPFRSEYKASLAQELVLQEHLTAADLERSQQLAEQAYIQGSYSRDTLSILKYYYFS